MDREMSDRAPARNSSPVVKFLVFLLVLLLLGVGVLTYIFIEKQQEAAVVELELRADKDSISQSLEHLIVEYDALSTDNAKLQGQVAKERAHAEELLAEVKRVKNVSYAKIREYQRELGTLRAIMRGMVKEIDSLNTINKDLQAENVRVLADLKQTQTKAEELSVQNEELNQRVFEGAKLTIRNLTVAGLNKRDKVTSRHRWTRKLRTCFTLMANSITTPGQRPVYLRMTAPDGSLMLDNMSGNFLVGETTIEYTALRSIDYQNQDIELCIYNGEGFDFLPGIYHAEIYLEGEKIAEVDHELK